MQQHTCKNCGNTFEVDFCNVCGQKNAHRLDVKHILHEVAHVFTHADKGIIAFIPKIITKPGVIALDYVEGKRKRYFNPLQYLVIIVGFVTYFVSKTQFMEQTFSAISSMNSSMSNPELSPRVAHAQAAVVAFFQKYMNFVMFLMIPFYAFFSWLFFKNKKYNFAEHVMAQIAFQAQSNTILLLTYYPLLYFFAIKSSVFFIVFPVISLVFCITTTYSQFLKIPWWVALLKGILVYICASLVQTVITAIVTAITLLSSK